MFSGGKTKNIWNNPTYISKLRILHILYDDRIPSGFSLVVMEVSWELALLCWMAVSAIDSNNFSWQNITCNELAERWYPKNVSQPAGKFKRMDHTANKNMESDMIWWKGVFVAVVVLHDIHWNSYLVVQFNDGHRDMYIVIVIVI